MHTPEYVSIYSLFRLFLHAGLLAAGVCVGHHIVRYNAYMQFMVQSIMVLFVRTHPPA